MLITLHLTILLPLIMAVLILLSGRFLGAKFVSWLLALTMGCVALLATSLLIPVMRTPGLVELVPVFEWFSVGRLTAMIEWRLDLLSALMLTTVSWVSFCVHLYSVAYMAEERGLTRFMALLSLFTFMMFLLVTANNFLQMLLGWEGVGLLSYLLIGFWYEKESAVQASFKAFIVNRMADWALILGIVMCFVVVGTVDFNTLFGEAARFQKDFLWSFAGVTWDPLLMIGALIFIGSMGKSAQIGFHVWLPDAMEGPTPVSALIHAATMVTAGVFILVRLSPLLQLVPALLSWIGMIGVATALMAGLLACVQNDMKRVIAYSTCSQLGLMFLAVGVEAYTVAFFHLVTHAFFKALLFLGAGSVSHALSGEQDMRQMGGVWRLIPFTYGVMWIGTLALVGVPFFSGYYSKDLIFEMTFFSQQAFAFPCYVVALVVAALTAFYMGRLLLMTFHGTPHANDTVMAHITDAPPTMAFPLIVLAVGAIFAGVFLQPLMVGPFFELLWMHLVPTEPTHVGLTRAHYGHIWPALMPMICALLGVGIAFIIWVNRARWTDFVARRLSYFYGTLIQGFYFNQAYHLIFVRPTWALGRFFETWGDTKLIDGWIVGGLIRSLRFMAVGVRRTQEGAIADYVFVMILSLTFLGGVLLWTPAGGLQSPAISHEVQDA